MYPAPLGGAKHQTTFILHTVMHNSPSPPSGKSDHDSILLLPIYKQKLKQEVPVTRSIQKWSDEADARIHDCFASTDWDMFCYSSNTTSVINMCIDDIIHTVTIPHSDYNVSKHKTMGYRKYQCWAKG
jgi:hypothetical protein